ncbi:hypothetical protein ACHWQZ_G001359 [Mnemiopsis leidyi]
MANTQLCFYILSLILLCHCEDEDRCRKILAKVEDCRRKGFKVKGVEDCPVIAPKSMTCQRESLCQRAVKNAVKDCGYTCGEKDGAFRGVVADNENKTIYIITPTYNRPTQLAELTIMAQSLKDVSNVIWLVVEQWKHTEKVSQFLSKISTPHLHLTSFDRVKEGNLCNGLRNEVLDFMRRYDYQYRDGVIHFANLDRVYATQAFEEMRKVEHVGIWPTERSWEQFECQPFKFYPNKDGIKYPIDVGSIGFSSNALLDSELTFDPAVSDVEGVSRMVAGLVKSKDELEIVSCDGRFVWKLPFFSVKADHGKEEEKETESD